MFIMVPNKIFNHKLSGSEMLVYCGILSYTNRFGRAIVKAERIAARCSLSVNTVYAAIASLCNRHLICKRKRIANHYNIANCYDIINLKGGFFMLDTNIFSLELSPTSFLVYTYLLKRTNKKGIAYPSLNTMHTELCLSIDTIVDKLDYLSEVGLCSKLTIIRQDGGFGHNNYKLHQSQDVSLQGFLDASRRLREYAVVSVARSFFVDGNALKTDIKKVFRFNPSHSLLTA